METYTEVKLMHTHPEMPIKDGPAVSDSTETGATKRDCSRCQTNLEPDWKRCPMCGTQKQQQIHKSCDELRAFNLKCGPNGTLGPDTGQASNTFDEKANCYNTVNDNIVGHNGTLGPDTGQASNTFGETANCDNTVNATSLTIGTETSADTNTLKEAQCFIDAEEDNNVCPTGSIGFISSQAPNKLDKDTEKDSVLPSSSENGFQRSLFNIKDEYGHRGLSGVLKKVRNNILNGKIHPPQILVVGSSGKGKSSLINSILSLRSENDGAAEVGLLSTTKETRKYQNNNYPKIVLWDTPGINTKDETYLTKICFEKFDFFIIVSGNRFTDIDAWLVEATQKLKKKCYFVRTNIDNDIRSEYETDLTENMLKEDCSRRISDLDLGIEKPDVFIVSNIHHHKYDLNSLRQKLNSLQTELMKEQTELMKEQIKQIFQDKKRDLQSRITRVAFCVWLLSKLNFFCHFNILMKEVQSYQSNFGIDDKALHNLAELLKKPFDDLKRPLSSTWLMSLDTFKQACFSRTSNSLDPDFKNILSQFLEDCFHECERMLDYAFENI